MSTQLHGPLQRLTPTDKAAWIIMATLVGLTFLLLTDGLRWYIRYRLAPPLRLHDKVMFLATVSVIKCIAVTWLTG